MLQHDPATDDRKCAPYTDSDDENGNYIMYYAAISGRRINNNKFSPCSTSEIGAVLKQSRNTACFKGELLIECITNSCIFYISLCICTCVYMYSSTWLYMYLFLPFIPQTPLFTRIHFIQLMY